MELYLLDENWENDLIIENYDSLIWTERHVINGDFELTSGNIDYINSTINLGDFLNISKSFEVMYVEEKLIEKKDNAYTITVKGRSAETFLENVLFTPYHNRAIGQVGSSIKRSDLCQSIIDGSIPAYGFSDSNMTAELTGPFSSVLWNFTEEYLESEPNIQFKLEPKTAYDALMELISPENWNVYAKIPGSVFIAKIPGSETPGIIFHIAKTPNRVYPDKPSYIPEWCIAVLFPEDRTVEKEIAEGYIQPALYIDSKAHNFDYTYLTSNKNLKTHFAMNDTSTPPKYQGPFTSNGVLANNGVRDFNRREVFLDRNKSVYRYVIDQGKAEIKNYKVKSLITVNDMQIPFEIINPETSYYLQDNKINYYTYNLGDILGLKDPILGSLKVRAVERIINLDQNGLTEDVSFIVIDE